MIAPPWSNSSIRSSSPPSRIKANSCKGDPGGRPRGGNPSRIKANSCKGDPGGCPGGRNPSRIKANSCKGDPGGRPHRGTRVTVAVDLKQGTRVTLSLALEGRNT